MNKGKKNRPERTRTVPLQLSWTFLLRYILCQLVYLGALTGMVIAALGLYYHYDLSMNAAWQRWFWWIHDYFYIIMLAMILIGWTAITFFFFRHLFGYMELITEQAENAFSAQDSEIRLPDEIAAIEDKLNLIRQRAQSNLRIAKEAEQRKNDLLVYLAHDLKTPLTSVVGYLSLLEETPDLPAEARARYTGIALDKALRLEELINEFFEITRFNLTSMELVYREVDLRKMLEQVINEFTPLLQERNLSCRLEMPEKINYRCDPDKLVRVFDNLLRNATFYSYENSEITVSGRIEGNHAVVTCENDGDDIPKEKLDRLFEQFFRLDTSRASHSGGAGLGLAIAKQIVALHGGEIRAECNHGHICFTVTLPLSQENLKKS